MVSPNAAKVDIPKLRRDVPKFSTSGLSSQDLEWWNHFLSELDNTFHDLSATSDTWLLDKLLLLKSTGAVAAVNTPQITEGLSRLHSAVFTQIPEVCLV